MSLNQAAGTLSLDQFSSDLRVLVEEEDWTLVTKGNHQPFIKRTFHVKARSTCKSQNVVDTEDSDDNEQVTTTLPDLLQCECHVVYSDSYCNPVLFFNIYDCHGKTFPLEYIWESIVESSFVSHIKHNPWSFLTQAEHPVLSIPFFQLHPCHTADFMKPLHELSRSENVTQFCYVRSWLSIVLQVIGINSN